MSSRRLAHASALLAAEVDAGRVAAGSLLVARNGHVVLHAGYGAPADAVYLLASISKPVNAVALMLLVERGLVALDAPVSRYLPEFAGADRAAVRVRDLLTHTSGLPDMVPDNLALRRAHAPLSAFVQAACRTPLLFAPQTGFSYQSMGTLLAGEIVQRVAGQPLREFHQREIFDVLGMPNSSLGLGGRPMTDSVRCQTDDSADMERFGPNTLYWRDMGHPWGGMLSTVSDLALLLQMFLDGGHSAGRPFLAPATVAGMTSDQNAAIGAPWALGWGLATSPVWVYCGDRVSPRTFGHSGATGTVAWADPDTQVLTVILTTRPTALDDGRLLCDISNAVATAVLPESAAA
ncbi:MAG: beta-lactamase family protein [Rhodoferax sp.]|nr:beta-lactamase family protein [Rhodoferax sp.]